MNTLLTIETEGVPFAVDSQLQQLIEDRHGRGCTLYAIESIVGHLRRTLVTSVHRVELYGVPPEQLYVKMQSGSHSWQEEWRLQFEHAGVQLSKVG